MPLDPNAVFGYGEDFSQLWLMEHKRDGTHGRKFSVSQRVKNMVDAAVMGTPPTITAGVGNAATVIAGSVLHDYASPEPKIINGPLKDTGTAGQRSPAAPFTLPGAALSPSNLPWFISFVFEGQSFEFLTKRFTSIGFRIWANEQPHAATPTFMPSGGTSSLVLVDFGTRARRRVMIEFAGSNTTTTYGGLRYLPTDTVSPPAEQSPLRILFLGDSQVQGSGAAAWSSGFPIRTARLLGFDDFILNGDSGTGVTHANNGLGAKYRDRLATDVIPQAPDVVVISGSTNDSGDTGIQAETQALVNAITAALPTAIVVVVGLLYPGTFSAPYNTIHAAMKAGAAAAGVPFIDTQSPSLWSFGTGRIGATTGNGPSDTLLESLGGGVHLSDAGHLHYGDRLAIELGRILGIGVG